MRKPAVDTPELSDAASKAATGKTLKQWFQVLDDAGGLEAGRRTLTQHLLTEHGVPEWWAVTLTVEHEMARGQAEKDGRPKGYSICSTKTISAPVEKVFAAFGDAQLLGQWFGAKAKVEFKDGGSLASADGDAATITRIRKDKDLRLTWNRQDLAPGSTVEVLFADKGKGKTGLTLNHGRILSRREADEVRAGWSAAFDALKALLEAA